jgi:hypothetical protein
MIITRLMAGNSKVVVELRELVGGTVALEVEEAKPIILFIEEEEKMLFVEDQEITSVVVAKIIKILMIVAVV